jgi:glycosyltransferase involved in cell wall biosynthesis
MNLPKVSVLIPCYNHEKYVVQCLESLNEAYSGELEVIICDDASGDRSVELIEGYIKRNRRFSFNFIKHNENKGITKTLNSCLNYATSDYIYIIASDDYLLKNGLSKAMEYLLHSASDAVISDCIVVNSESSLIYNSAFFDYRHASLKRLKNNLAEELVFNWVVPGPSLLLKKSIYSVVGYYDESLLAEDRDFYLRMNKKSNVIFSEDKIACYRIHSSNASASHKYLASRKNEFASVNYKNHILYSGLSEWYLKTYKLDQMGLIILPLFFRKLLKTVFTFLS